jgi:hypothetical protein
VLLPVENIRFEEVVIAVGLSNYLLKLVLLRTYLAAFDYFAEKP